MPAGLRVVCLTRSWTARRCTPSASAGAVEIALGLLADEIDPIAHGHFHVDQMEAKRLRQVPLNVTARRTARTTLYRHLEIRGERVGPAPCLQQPHHAHMGANNRHFVPNRASCSRTTLRSAASG